MAEQAHHSRPVTAYTPRVVDAELDALLRELPAVAIEGPKGAGKTATAQRRAATVFRLDDPTQREISAADPRILLTATPPNLIHEWQHQPGVLDAGCRAVDRDPRPNPNLLTRFSAAT